jgi:hypothetical protein
LNGQNHIQGLDRHSTEECHWNTAQGFGFALNLSSAKSPTYDEKESNLAAIQLIRTAQTVTEG